MRMRRTADSTVIIIVRNNIHIIFAGQKLSIVVVAAAASVLVLFLLLVLLLGGVHALEKKPTTITTTTAPKIQSSKKNKRNNKNNEGIIIHSVMNTNNTNYDQSVLQRAVGLTNNNLVEHLSESTLSAEPSSSVVDTLSEKQSGAINERKRKNKVDVPTSVTSSSYEKQRNDDDDESRSSNNNDKLSNFDPMNIRSHLYHAIEGLDRYPNYLSRWHNDNDIDRLEHSLLHYLERVRTQRQLLREYHASFIEPIIQKFKEEENVKQTTTTTTNDDTDDNSNNINRNDFCQLMKPPITWEEIKNILHPDLCKVIFRSRIFQSNSNDSNIKDNNSPPISVADVLSGHCDIHLDDIASLTDIMDEELYDVFSVPLFRPKFCHQLKRYIQEFIRLQRELVVVGDDTDDCIKNNNNNNNHNDKMIRSLLHRPIIDLDTIGLSWINDLVFHLILQPLCRHLFHSTETSKKDLDWRQGYVASYHAPPSSSSSSNDDNNNNDYNTTLSTKIRTNLVTHTDDSEVTLNICLSDENEFDGGLIEFRGLRNSKNNNIHAANVFGIYQPSIGKAIIHSGRHFHRVTPVTDGNRYVYIMWARSWIGSRARYCPCCWLNRRIDTTTTNTNSCICGPQWN